MSQDFITALQVQLREAALREERRPALATRAVRARRRLPEAGPAAAALVGLVLLALAALLAAAALRGERPATPEVIADHRVAAGLSSLAGGFGAAWATDPVGGRLLRIDPKTRRVVARVPVRGDMVVTTGAGAVWVLAGDLLLSGDHGPVRVLRIDPATNRVVARVRVPGGLAVQEIRVVDGAVWALGPGGALRVDPRSNTPDGVVRFPGGAARGAVFDADAVRVLGADGRVRTLDAGSGRVLHTLRVPATSDTVLEPGRPGTFTLVSGDRLTVFDAGTARRRWSTALGADVRRWTSDGHTVWVVLARAPDAADRLVRLDAATGARLGQVDLPEPDAAGLARVGSELWVAAPGGQVEIVSR